MRRKLFGKGLKGTKRFWEPYTAQWWDPTSVHTKRHYRYDVNRARWRFHGRFFNLPRDLQEKIFDMKVKRQARVAIIKGVKARTRARAGYVEGYTDKYTLRKPIELIMRKAGYL